MSIPVNGASSVTPTTTQQPSQGNHDTTDGKVQLAARVLVVNMQFIPSNGNPSIDLGNTPTCQQLQQVLSGYKSH